MPRYAGFRGERYGPVFYELRAEIAAFLAQNNSPLADLFSNSVWLAHVAYLADVFEQLNTLNMSMQGRGNNIFEQYDKIDAFKKKISVWASHVSKNRLDRSPMSVMRNSNWTLQERM